MLKVCLVDSYANGIYCYFARIKKEAFCSWLDHNKNEHLQIVSLSHLTVSFFV